MLSFYISQIDADYQSERFIRLYNKHRDKMMSAAFAILKNHHDAEEAVQNALFAIAKNIAVMPDPDTKHGENYAVKAAKNHALNIAKKRRLSAPIIEIYADGIDIAAEIDDRDECKRVVEAIYKMKSCYRDVLSAKFLYGMSAKEISVLFGVPLQTVKSRINRGIKILKKAFEGDDYDV
ncbi:MAG: sigma-70 family RNA polymerase sigma factor [Oscillospiraceae bacterium]|nr:sigma-70 family RNA polymerase sigma factor [Oscillospiraceae bacterium]